MHGAYILTYPHLLFKTVENSFSPGILHHGQRGSAVLMAGSMDELHKEAQRNNQQANGDDNEGGYDHRSARLVDTRCIRLVGHWLDLLQIAQIMEEITHQLVPLSLVTTNGPHHHGSQCRRELRIREK